MTVKPNPKKLRPYTEPPKQRRPLLPGGPDSAATGFLVAAILWLAAALGIGALAIGARIISFELSQPLGLFDLSFEFTQRRVDAAFANATVYGFLGNAGLSAITFMTPRLMGRRLAAEPLVSLAVAIWNLALLGGIGALYVFDLGPNAHLTAMHWLFTGGLAFAALIVTGSFLATVGSSVVSAYVSIWFAGIALLGLLGLTGLAAAINLGDVFLDIPPLAIGLVSVAVERLIISVWLLGMAYAVLHYVVPRAADLPLASSGLAILTWLLWLAFAPLSGLGALVDPAVPYAVTTVGSVATMLLLAPVSLAAVNLWQTISSRLVLLTGVSPVAFAAVAVTFLLAVALLDAIFAIGAVTAYVGGTVWEQGWFVWAAYGAFGLAALGMLEHELPRLLKRAWGGGVLSGAQLGLLFGGATIAGLSLMGAGLAEGAFRTQGASADVVASGLLPYLVGAFLGIGLAALGGLASLVNLFLAYTSAAPAEYIVPGQSAPAAAGH